jgi:bifunctional NMN adenylyltransferase/nudix hydrolase
MEYALGVFIGRFQPFHMGHIFVASKALENVSRLLILIGSSFEPRSIRNPWTFEEREKMLRSCFSAEQNSRIICEPLIDIRYNDVLWITEVQRITYMHNESDQQIALIRYESEAESRDYTVLFPQWGYIGIEHELNNSGRDIRHELFSSGEIKNVTSQLPTAIHSQVQTFIDGKFGKDLCNSHSFLEKYKKGWEASPFPPTHITVDAVVIQSGHVLLVRRGAQPGKGLYALPGGFIGHEELLSDSIIRKLKEETQIKVPVPVLLGSIKNQVVFDAPFRSDRGRTITHAFYIELRNEKTLPKIKHGGEAENCIWMPLGKLNSMEMFEDHYFIIQKMVGVI